MAQIREIKKRAKAVGTIERITKTMQMIATAKFTAAVQRTNATKPYTQTIRRLVGEVAEAAGDVDHPLISGPAERMGKEVMLLISSDRGLCGAYNGSVLRTATKHYRTITAGGTDIEVEVSGKKAIGYFNFQKIEIARNYVIGDKPSYDAVEEIASEYIQRFSTGHLDAVRIAYMRFESNARQVPTVMQLLPLKPEAAPGDDAAASGAGANYEFSPSSEALLEDLLPLAVKSQLFQAFNDAVVSEQIMRMIAMKAATENAKDLKRTLTRQLNRARQSQITTELTEIVGGTAALE